ncbi:MAG: hypothetical protein IK000_03085 [Bacteroidaceae bacterium]|nr:hypothetical protein [Bacteroidaceae bacterium]
MTDIDELLEGPYWIVDILPKQVPAGGGGQYFRVEQYYLRRMPLLHRKYTDLMLKLNCYADMAVSHDGECWVRNPEPEVLEQHVGACLTESPREAALFIVLPPRDTLLVIERECAHMTAYNASDDLVALIRQLAAGEGLFVWQPPKEEETNPSLRQE